VPTCVLTEATARGKMGKGIPPGNVTIEPICIWLGYPKGDNVHRAEVAGFGLGLMVEPSAGNQLQLVMQACFSFAAVS
jgi:hypothetical protein